MRTKQTTTTSQHRRKIFCCISLLTLLLGWGPTALSADRGEALRVGEFSSVTQVARDTSIERKFDQLALRVRATGMISVIVQLATEGDNAPNVEQLQNDLLEALVGYDPAAVKRYSFLPILGVRINLTGLESLRASPLVQDIEEDVRMSPTTRVRPYNSGNTVVRPAVEWNGAGQTIVRIEARERSVEWSASEGTGDCSQAPSRCDRDPRLREGEGKRGDLAPAAIVRSIPVNSPINPNSKHSKAK